MPSVSFAGRAHDVAPGETVLDCLLRHGVDAPYSCRAGSCGTCLMRAVSGTVPAKAQIGLKDSWRAEGYFLPCVCEPAFDLELAQVAGDARMSATIAGLDLLSPDVMRVRLATETPMHFRAGQHVSIVRASAPARSYSIASLPEDGVIELHVRRIPNGSMSGWLHTEAREGHRVTLIGPSGDCFYVPGDSEQPLLLAGTGTGLAPLLGILRDALRAGHRGSIHVFHGALHTGGLYLVEELRRIAAQYPNVDYTPVVLQGSEADNVVVGPLDQTVLRKHPQLKGWRAYVCGDPAIVQMLRRKFFLAGAGSRDIYADAFVPSAPSPVQASSAA